MDREEVFFNHLCFPDHIKLESQKWEIHIEDSTAKFQEEKQSYCMKLISGNVTWLVPVFPQWKFVSEIPITRKLGKKIGINQPNKVLCGTAWMLH